MSLTGEITRADALLSALEDFHARACESAPVGKLLARWDRLVEVRALSEPRRSFFLRSQGGRMLAPAPSAEGTPDIVIAADESVLAGVFRGELNPARAHLEGELQAFGSQKDQLVLDAIVLLIWGY
ncbi:SCP2 sterol-binding domain-containing protein [bacterium]|nr:SCP2 sterol-binding domain-containing protein [bacterium]